MKKILLFLTLCCISNFLFSQTQKGTHFFGTSQFSTYRSGELQFFGNGALKRKNLTIQYGIFIKDNVLLGASFQNSPDIVWATFNASSGNSIGLNPFYRRYFGQKKIKPFVEGQIGVKLFRKNLYAKAELRSGAAFFLSSNTSLDLSFNFPILDNSIPPSRLFPQGIVPRIGLALRFLLKYDSDAESTISAKEMLKKGIFLADFSSSAISKSKNTSILTNVSLKYFLLNNIYVRGGLNISVNRNNFFNRFNNQFDLKPNLGLGGYLHVGDYTALAIHASGQQSLFRREEYSIKKKAHLTEAQVKAGVALFFDRQKLEILSGLEFIGYESDIADIPSQSNRSFVFTVDYEYFFSDRLSINTSVSAFPESQRQNFLSGILRQRTVYTKRYDLNLNLRLNWFINTKSLKKEKVEE